MKNIFIDILATSDSNQSPKTTNDVVLLDSDDDDDDVRADKAE